VWKFTILIRNVVFQSTKFQKKTLSLLEFMGSWHDLSYRKSLFVIVRWGCL